MMGLGLRAAVVALVAFLAWGTWTGLSFVNVLGPDAYLFERLRPTIPPTPESGTGGVTVQFLGTSTLIFTDGETTVLTDGFFTRKTDGLVGAPWMLYHFLSPTATVQPNATAVAACLKRAGVREAAALAVMHSHHDHSMDSALVCRRLGCTVLGSESTANVVRGGGLPERQILAVDLPSAEALEERGDHAFAADADTASSSTFTFGKFRVSLLRSRHIWLPVFGHLILDAAVPEPLVPPASLRAYKEGTSYSVLIEHPEGSALVQGSANFVRGALQGKHADVVFLGAGGIDTKDAEYRQTYWRETVEAVGAKRVVPVHWDDFTVPLDDPNIEAYTPNAATWDFMSRSASAGGQELAFLPIWGKMRL